MSYLCVCICSLHLKFGDSLPHALLDPHARDLQQRQGVVYRFDGDVESLGHLKMANAKCNFFLHTF